MGAFTFSNLLAEIGTNGLGESFLLPTVLNMTLTASVVILFVLLARLALKKAPKIFSYTLWAVVLFRLLCPVSITTDFSLLGSLNTPALEMTEHTTTVEYIPYDIVHTRDLEVHLPVGPVINEAVNEALPQEHAALGADPLEGEMAIASAIWLLGAAAMVAYSVVSYLLLRRRLVGTVSLRDNIYLADRIGSPFVMGFFRPKIYLPSSLSEQEQAYIILHEQHHIHRLDHVVKGLAFIALCIHWFNPLVWVAFVLSSKDMEMSCDEAVVKKLGEGIRADYSASLLSLATGRRIIAGTPLAFGEGDTKSRIKNMLNWKKPKTWIILVALIACVVAIVFCATNPRNDSDENGGIITWEVDAESDAVVDIVNDYVMRQVAYYNSLGAGENAIGGEYSILEAKVVGLERRYNGMATKAHRVELYRLEYRLLPSEPDHVVLADGMQMEDGWITERGSTGQPYFAILCDSSSGEETRTLIGMTGSRTINLDYNTDEMKAKYGDRYAAAAMELYKAYLDAKVQSSYGTAEDVAYYLELAALGETFQPMDEVRKAELLAEYGELLEGYTLLARESTDGKTAYIVGSYSGNVENSPLYMMYSMEVSTGEDDSYQLLYREADSAAVEQAYASSRAPDVGHMIHNSRITWSPNSAIVLIQPNDTALTLDVALNRYLYTPNGREYITDAASRGIDMCSRTEPFLYVYRISEQFGEIAERISLTEAEAAAILAEERVKITEGFGFSATLHVNGETTYYNEREGIPQTVLDLAVEKCDYRFGDPSYITDTIREARLDCDWLDVPLYADEADLPRLREILKNADQGYVGACGYGAKLTLTFTGGEKLTVFKGTDGCDTIVFGSYGGYFIGDEENTEFWQMFGLDPETKEPLAEAPEQPEEPLPSAPPTEADIHAAITANFTAAAKGNAANPFLTEAHHILSQTQEGNTHTVYALVCCASYDAENGRYDLYDASCPPTAMTFTYGSSGWQLTEYWTALQGGYFESSVREKFPQEAAAVVFSEQYETISAELLSACDDQAVRYYAARTNQVPAKVFTPEDVEFTGQALSTTRDKMSYEERLAWVQAGTDDQQSHTSLGQYVEGEGCISYLGQWVGTPHMNQYTLDIRLADGITADLPLPRNGEWGVALPDTMKFEGGKFIYEVNFPTEELTNEGQTLIHLKGTYRYEVDLVDKTLSLTVLQ